MNTLNPRTQRAFIKPAELARGFLPILICAVLIGAVFIATKPVEGATTSFSQNAPQPILIPKVPIGVPAPVVDGACNKLEYSTGFSASFNDASQVTGSVFLVQDSQYLYVCVTGAAGQKNDRFYAVYLSTQNKTVGFAGPTDYALDVDIPSGAQTSGVGTGIGNYTPATIPGWSAVPASGNADSAEYSIPLALTGGACGDNFRIAVYHHRPFNQGVDYGWPGNQWYDQPGTWMEAVLSQKACGSGKIAYVYREDTYTAGKFKTLLTANGYGVDLIPLSTVTSTIFSGYTAIVIAQDTGSLDQWGSTASQVAQITAGGKPTLGLGEGGYAFFGKQGKFTGWPHGWHGPNDRVLAVNTGLAYFHDPYDFSGLLSDPLTLYTLPVNEVGIYLVGQPPDATAFGMEPPAVVNGNPDHAPLITQSCDGLWGFSNGPQDMTTDAGHLFVNALNYLIKYTKCNPPPVVQNCVTLTKSASLPSTTVLHPGDTLKYTLTIQVLDNQACAASQATLVDDIPYGSAYVPGSASDGISPTPEGALIWTLNLPAGALITKNFSVHLTDNACENLKLANYAKLSASTGLFTSNTVSHNVACPPVTPVNHEPPYAEEEVTVYPYPLRAGTPTQLSARLRNNSAASQTVTVTFQTSPNKFGIGLNFTALPVPGNPRLVTIPAHGVIEVRLNWTPVVSGLNCIQVKIEGAGYNPIFTQHNLDVAENLRPGVTDSLTFKVGNPTAASGDILLVVDNTCPGWTAVIIPSTLAGVGPNDTDMRTATLQVTPPSGGILGTGCHIDVQGWLNGVLIGGIRKLDVPPVNLPAANPPWEEMEISTQPDPAVIGQVNQYCIELQNPLTVTKVVTVTYAEADFGAGIGFTPVGSRRLDLPPSSLNKYCINWTPGVGGTLHRCLLVTLSMPNFRDQHSQRNIEAVRAMPGSTSASFSVGNTSPFTRTLQIVTTPIGMTGFIIHMLPDPPPDLMPGQIVPFMLQVRQAAFDLHTPFVGGQMFGDTVRVEVSVYLGGDLISGFTVEIKPFKITLPYLFKK